MLTVGIPGGTGSGKTTILARLNKDFLENDIGFISQDSYYNDNGKLSFDEKNKINFDHPDAIDFELIINHLNLLKNKKNINQPIYSFIHHNRIEKTKLVKPKKIMIIEGILILNNIKLRDIIDYKVFVDATENLRFKRRLDRDINERGRIKEEVIELFNTRLNKMHKLYVEPMKEFCDIIIDNNNKVDLLEINPIIDVIKSHL